MDTLLNLLPELQEKLQHKPLALYPDSYNDVANGQLCLADFGADDALLFWGKNCPFQFNEVITVNDLPLAVVPLTHNTAVCLHHLLPFTAPQPVLGHARSFGLGDRLGIATVGHIRAIADYDVYPVFAQQSMRELTLMGKTYDDVLDRVTFQVLQAGYKKGYGADGDHLKSADEIRYAIGCGYTMITLDCSEHIHSDGVSMTEAELEAVCPLPPALEAEYLNRVFTFGDVSIRFSRADLLRARRIYGEALDFAKTIYDTCIAGTPVELEISIDEIDAPTTPAQHLFVANELIKAGVVFKTLAPRFCGEFQKGIDYIGDLGQFDRELKQHVAIVEHFGYKLSVHSGSDKFAVFPAVGRMTHSKFHLKTSGTSWLEALRLVSITSPDLFREIYHYAQTVYTEARSYYHVSTEPEQIPSIDDMDNPHLPSLLGLPASRQLLHITYGKIMNDTEHDFRSRLYRLWRERRTEYDTILMRHIRRHLELLMGK